MARREANRRFTYGYGRAEDVAGAIVLLFVVGSAILAAIESLAKLHSGEPPHLIGVSMLAANVLIHVDPVEERKGEYHYQPEIEPAYPRHI